jgi:glutamate formiminotransferase/formiminotetrahydrofolate cyclodeaminase
MKIVECVPNFSEGRDLTRIEAITAEIKAVSGVQLLDVDPGADTNRTVVTMAGPPEGVVEAAFRAIKRASELIDMSSHRGEHPRMGATDVCPFVPVSEVTMEECVELAKELGRRVGDELGIPVYLYEHAATSPQRKSLADIREGEYEALEQKLKDPAWAPDFGPAEFNAQAGATVIGARDFLIAYNVNLNTKDKRLASEIALNIRETGRTVKGPDGKALKGEDGKPVKKPGRLKSLRAVGWYIDTYRQAQVSINLINYKVTPPHVAFETVREEAARLGLRVTGSELVGLIPLEPLLDAGRYFLAKQGKSPGVPEPELIEVAVQSLGLDQFSDFEAEKKVIEYRFLQPAPLASMKVIDFVDEVSRDSPAPGGGSVSALCGSLGAALASMVANLTYDKGDWEAMGRIAVEGQRIKDALRRNIDADTDAFNVLMEAVRLPKKTEEEKAAREGAIQDGYKIAAEVPLSTAKLCLEALELSLQAARDGNKASASDAGVAALAAWAGMEGALLNVQINAKEIDDPPYVSALMEQVKDLRDRGAVLRSEALDAVDDAIYPQG